jgi:hypothetical protein
MAHCSHHFIGLYTARRIRFQVSYGHCYVRYHAPAAVLNRADDRSGRANPEQGNSPNANGKKENKNISNHHCHTSVHNRFPLSDGTSSSSAT